MRLRRAGLAIVWIIVAFSPAITAANDAHEIEGLLETNETVTFNGVVDAYADTGALHFRGPSPSLATVSLEADNVVFTVQWANGTEVKPENLAAYQQTTDSGEYTREFAKPEVLLLSRQETPEVLTIVPPEQGSMKVGSPESTEVQGHVVSNQSVTKVGTLSTAAEIGSVGTNPGFWFHIDGPWTAEGGLSSAQVTGNFTLFAHNVTFDVTASDQGSWKVDAGRTEQPGPIPHSRDYSLQVVTVEVFGGVLEIETQDALSLYAPRIHSAISGTAFGQAASGRLLSSDAFYEYSDAQFSFDGEGTVVLRPVANGGRVNAGPAPSPRLELDVGGAFAVTPTRGLVTGSAPASSSTAPGWIVPWAAAFVVLVLLPVATVVARARTRPRAPTRAHIRSVSRDDLMVVDEILGPLVSEKLGPADRDVVHSFAEQMGIGRRLIQQRDYVQAIIVFEELARSHPTCSNVFEHLAEARMGTRDYERAADAYAECNRLIGGADSEVFVDWLRASWLAGRKDEACRILTKFSVMDPGHAAALVERGDFKELGLTALERGVELDLDMLESWTRLAWRRNHRNTAQLALARIVARRPEAAMHVITDASYAGLVRATLDELDAHGLKAVVRLAWRHEDSLGLARDVFVQLVWTNPAMAERLLEDPAYETLRDDVRVQSALREARRTMPSDRGA